MKTLALSLRNMLRNRRRSFATLMAIVIGTASILVFGGYRANITYGLQTSEVRRIGHLQIQRTGYFLYGSGSPTEFGIADYERVIATIQRDPVLAPMVRVVAPLLHLGGIAGNSSRGVSRTVLAVGLPAAEYDAMQRWNAYRMWQRPDPTPLLNAPPDGAVIGVGVARALQLCEPLRVAGCRPLEKNEGPDAHPSIPDDLTALARANADGVKARGRVAMDVLAATAQGAPNVARLSVVRAESQGVKELDDIHVEMHLAQAQQLVYGRDKPEVTAIAVQLQRTDDVAVARTRLARMLRDELVEQNLEVHDFMTLSPAYGQTVALYGAIFGFISALISAIVLFMISNTMSMAVLERTVEIGTLRAMGLRRSGVVMLFLGEAMLLSLLAVGIGILAALAIAEGINNSGITWTPPGRVDAIPLTVRAWGETGLMIRTAALLMAVALLSALLPSRRAARTNIVDALRHV